MNSLLMKRYGPGGGGERGREQGGKGRGEEQGGEGDHHHHDSLMHEFPSYDEVWSRGRGKRARVGGGDGLLGVFFHEDLHQLQ